MVSAIWLFLILSGSICFVLTGNISGLNNEILSNGNKALKLMFEIMPTIVLWSGLLKIAEDSGVLKKFADFLRPMLIKLFPSLNHDSKALGYISSNIAANALGLGSAATPAGLKAMKELSKENNNSSVASDAMVTFLILNTAGVTIIPTTILAMRVMYKSQNPSEIIIPAVLATGMSCVSGLLLDYLIRRKRKSKNECDF